MIFISFVQQIFFKNVLLSKIISKDFKLFFNVSLYKLDNIHLKNYLKILGSNGFK